MGAIDSDTVKQTYGNPPLIDRYSHGLRRTVSAESPHGSVPSGTIPNPPDDNKK